MREPSLGNNAKGTIPNGGSGAARTTGKAEKQQETKNKREKTPTTRQRQWGQKQTNTM